MEAGSIVSGAAGRYAIALFDLAREAHAIESVEADLATLVRAIAQSSDLKRLLKSPVYSREVQARALVAVTTAMQLSPLTERFLGVVAHNRRLFALEAIIEAFTKLAAHARGETSAMVTSAQALSEPQMRSLEAGLRQAFGRAVKVSAKVDPDVLGGLLVRVGSVMVDSTLRSQLNQLKNAMREAR